MTPKRTSGFSARQTPWRIRRTEIATPHIVVHGLFNNLKQSLANIRLGGYSFSMEPTVNLFKALSDETRLRILSLLLSNGELCVCDIIAALKQPQSTISRHLAYLRKTGWVNDRRCGLWIYYSLEPKRIARDKGLVEYLRQHLTDLPTTEIDRKQLESLATGSNCA